MKPEQSLDIARTPDSVSAAIEETTGDSAQENKRRRLVRGAVALAPLVLTLRSGALAAASCTGARLVSVDNNGKFSDAYHQSDDFCIVNTPAPVCENYPITAGSTTKVLTQPAGLVSVVNNNGQGGYRCDTTLDLRNKTVAILSSTSACSLLGSCPRPD